MEQFRRALSIQPNYTNARYNLANALAAQGQLEEAAVDFRLMLAGAPEDRNSREELSAVLLRIVNAAMSDGRYEMAAGSYRELIALDGATQTCTSISESSWRNLRISRARLTNSRQP